MKKVVNGEEVDMTPSEVSARQAEEAAWAARHIPTDAEIDMDELNKALAQPGSVFRGFVLVMLDEINILRARVAALGGGPLPPRTVDQIKPAMQNKMRTP